MIRRALVTFVLLIVCFILQTSVFAVFPFTASTPNLMMIVTVSFALMRGDVCGLTVGFFAGLITDIFFGDVIGLYALLHMYAGFICGKFHKKFYPENIILPLSVIAIADLAYGAVCYVILFAARMKWNVLFYLVRVMLPEAVYTLICAVLIYPLILRINTWLEDLEQRSARKFV